MDNEKAQLMNRRRILIAALAGGGGAALASCTPEVPKESADSVDMWAGYDERITERTLAEAEKLFGLQFSETERQLILGGPVEEAEDGFFATQIGSLNKRRAQDIPNSLAPATKFDPRLPGISYANQDNSVALFPEEIGSMPDDPESIAFASVKQQSRWMTTGQITSRELTDIYLARIEKYGHLLECFVTVTADIARSQADQADRERATGQVRGPLHGIPYGVKDLLDTADVATTWGAMPYKERIASSDGAVVRLLQESGAVMLGKTTLGALAWGDVWFGGETRNPWNTKEGASGSSAGSGSATAAGLCSFGIGTETLGSIVSPSDRNGLAGLRPTFGRVSRAGAMALCWSLDKIGPMCRYAEDTALVLAAINGFDVEDASSIDMGFAYDGRQSLEGLTIGYDPSWFEGEDVRATDHVALEAIRDIGATVVEIALPDLPVTEIMAPLGAESAAAFEELTLSGRDDMLRRQITNAWPNSFRQSRYFSAVDYVQADRLRRSVMQQTHEFFSQVDVVFGPSFNTPMLSLTNFTGQPCLALRAGFEEITPRPLFDHPENDTDETLHRIPRSVSLWSNLYEEGNLIRVGRALETKLGVATERPPLA
ncbi:MAG: Asp-tRNA(Asn)/Glu-tRNA(Gln) amidotransferase A subunit family amidase [Woeseiaceae bacterium]|jgi:Asp-tRNA(Asn)/Glu-tRNA(Gln) amidotransferase A subunit family amidase